MESITHLINSIESFSKQNFKFSQYFQALNLLGKIPDTVSYRLNDIDLIHHLEEASKHIDWLNRFFEDRSIQLPGRNYPSLNPARIKMFRFLMQTSR